MGKEAGMDSGPHALKPPIHSLTAFRFLAALCVFLHHVDPSRFLEGFSGVSFFFVLSGFILTYNYRGMLASVEWTSLRRFYVARLTRMYPVHLLTFLAILPLLWTGMSAAPRRSLVRAFLNLTLIQSFSPGPADYGSYNAPSWSLSDEWFFYLALPFLLWVISRVKLCGTRRLASAMVSLWLATVCYCGCCRGSLRIYWLCYINPCLRIIDFAIGVLACLIFTRSPLHAQRRWAGNTAIFTVLEVSAVTALGLAWLFAGALPLAVRFGCYYTPVMTALVFIFAFERGLVSRLIRGRLGRFLGEVSFSFYMIHVLALLYVGGCAVHMHHPAFGPRTVAIVAFVVTLISSTLCYSYYEKPLRERLRRWLDGKRTKEGAAPVAETLTPSRAA
jgi:peptidoglycan/LPS O-acetylase OafA/YrhL